MTSEDLSKIPIFFILGRPRSGTTLLTTLFNAHPNIHIAPEYPVMLLLYQKFRKVKVWDEAAIRSFVDAAFYSSQFSHRRIENLKIDKETILNELLKYQGKGSIQLFLKSINYFAYTMFRKEETHWIGDKNPVYSIFSNRLRKIFPEAKFICINRDYRDNFISIQKLADKDVAVEAPNLRLQVARWRYFVRLFLKLKKEHPEKYYILKYEDLVTDQEKTFKSLCEFLGITYDPNVFEFYTKREEAVNTYGNTMYEKFHENLLKPISTARMNTWQEKLTEEQVKIADQMAGKYADRLGYERRKGFSFRIWLGSIPMNVYNHFLLMLMNAGTYLPYKVSQWLFTKSLILLRVYLKLSGKKPLPKGMI
ncbi:MAG: sulfotransferase family protein [Syntrophothermus sp.]